MLDPEAADEQRAKVTGDTKSRIESAGALKHEGEWGLRKMAYEIKNRNEAEYRVFRFEGEKPLLDDLDHSLKIADGVLRFRIFKTDPESPNTVPPDTFVIMQRNEDDDRPRGRGRGEGRGGPRRPRSDGERGGDDAVTSTPVVATETPAAAAEAPVEPAAAPAPEAVEPPAAPEAAAPEAPAEPEASVPEAPDEPDEPATPAAD